MKRITNMAVTLMICLFAGPVGAGPLDNWHPPTAPLVTNSLKAAAYGSGTFVAVGGGGVMLSSGDGISWSKLTSKTANDLNDVTFCNNTFVAVGDSGTILTSANGTDWDTRDSKASQNLDGVTCGNDMYVVVGGSGKVLTSTNAVDWSPQDSNVGQYLEAVAYGSGLFVAVGENGTIITSSNGLDWGTAVSGPTTNLHDVTWGNGLWVAVGSDGVIRKSSTGNDWIDSPSGSATWLRNILFNGSNFVVVGDSGLILSAPADISSWTQRISNTTQLLWGLTASNTAMVSVGISGIILRTDLVQARLNLTVTGSGGGEVSITPGNVVSSTSISHGFPYGTGITLQATPSVAPFFIGWSGECSGMNSCNLSMDVDRNVTTGFDVDWAHAAQIEGGGPYSSITSAYGEAAESGTVIDAWGIVFPETLVLDQPRAVTLKGGFDSGYYTNANGYTRVAGIQVQRGSLTVERVAIK